MRLVCNFKLWTSSIFVCKEGGFVMTIPILLIVVGFVLLIKGADFLVDGASNVAKRFHIPEIIIGLTIVSIGTSMPELFVSTTSAIEGYSDMAIGNVIGSNVCNLLLILGLSALISPVKFQKETVLIETPMCLLFTIVFMILCNTGTGISRIESIILLGLFVGFILYTIFMGLKGAKSEEKIESEAEKDNNKFSILKNILFIILGVVALKFGGDLTVDNAVIIAKHFNVSEQVISLTILAVGTSLPELVTSVVAAIKGNSDIAIGNIIGSNIFNMLLIIGVTSFISPILYNVAYNLDMIVLLISTTLLLLFAILPMRDEMNRWKGATFLVSYVVYLLILLQK